MEILSPTLSSDVVMEATTPDSLSGVATSPLASRSNRPPAPQPWKTRAAETTTSSAHPTTTLTGWRDTARPMRVNISGPS